MSYVIIAALVLIVAIFAIIGLKRGFVREFISLLGTAIAIILALWLSSPAADFIYDAFVENTVYKKVSSAVESVGVNAAAERIEEKIPTYLRRSADSSDKDISRIIDDAEESGSDRCESISKGITQKVAKPLFKCIIRIPLFIVIFIIAKILIKLVAKALNIVSKLPIINGANKVFGFLLGGLKGVVFAALVYFALSAYLKISGSTVFGIGQSDLPFNFGK